MLVGIAGSAETLGGVAGRNPAAQIWHQGQTSLGRATGREGNAIRCMCMTREESRGGGGEGENVARRTNGERGEVAWCVCVLGRERGREWSEGGRT